MEPGFGGCYKVVELPRGVKLLGATEADGLNMEVVITTNTDSAILYQHAAQESQINCKWKLTDGCFTSPVTYSKDLQKYIVVKDWCYVGVVGRKKGLFRLANTDLIKIGTGFIWGVSSGTKDGVVESLVLFDNWYYVSLEKLMALPVAGGAVAIDMQDQGGNVTHIRTNKVLLGFTGFREAPGGEMKVMVLARDATETSAEEVPKTVPFTMLAALLHNNESQFCNSIPNVVAYCILPTERLGRPKVAFIDGTGKLHKLQIGQAATLLCDLASTMGMPHNGAVSMSNMNDASMSLLVVANSMAQKGSLVFCYDLKNRRLVDQKLKSESKTTAAELIATAGRFAIMQVDSTIRAQYVVEVHNCHPQDGYNYCNACKLNFPAPGSLHKHLTSNECVNFGRVHNLPMFEAYM